MKRRLFKLALFLLLGCFTTICIAWSLAYWIDVEGWAMTRNNITFDIFAPPNDAAEAWKGSDDYRHLWQSLEDEGIDHDGMFEFQEYRLPGVHLLKLHAGEFHHWPDYEPTPDSLSASLPEWSDEFLLGKLHSVVDEEYLVSTQVLGTGWPLPALWCAPATADPSGSDEIYHSAVGGIALDVRPPHYWRTFRVRTLPLLPIWRGLILNTIFYAGILWLLWSSPFAARRFIRRRRCRCVTCGYDLCGTEQEGCPECGWGRDDGDNNMH